jgi:hypothetical protein
MSGYETPPPTNSLYFNTLFYYNPNSSAGGTGGSSTSVNYPVAQGLESFPVGINTGSEINFTNTDLSKNLIANVYEIEFKGNGTTSTTVTQANNLQFRAAQAGYGINIGDNATNNAFTIAANTNGMTLNKSLTCLSGNILLDTSGSYIKFADGSQQTTAYISANVPLLSSDNTWTANNIWQDTSWFQNDVTVSNGFIADSNSLVEFSGAASFINQTVEFENFPKLTGTTPNYGALTSNNFVTKGYTDLTYAGLAANNYFSGSNYFSGFGVSTTSNVSISAPNISLIGTVGTQDIQISGSYKVKYGLSTGFTSYYDGAYTLPTMVFTAPSYTSSTGKSPQFVFTFPGQAHYVVINAGGCSMVSSQYTSSSQVATPNTVVQTDTDVIIRGTS